MSRIPSPYGRVVPAGTTTRFEQHASPLSLGSTASPRFGNKRPSAQSSPSNNGSRPNANSPGSVIKSYNSPGNGEVGTLRKEMGRAVGLKLEDVDTADVEKLRAAAANAIKLHRRLQEVEIERANELRDLQAMMSSLQQKEEELTEFVASVQKRRQETDPYEKVSGPSARQRNAHCANFRSSTSI